MTKGKTQEEQIAKIERAFQQQSHKILPSVSSEFVM